MGYHFELKHNEDYDMFNLYVINNNGDMMSISCPLSEEDLIAIKKILNKEIKSRKEIKMPKNKKAAPKAKKAAPKKKTVKKASK